MTCIVAYDIEDTKIRNQVAKYLLSMGVRLQKSVFAIKVERHAFHKMSKKLETLAGRKGKIAIIRLCAGCQKNAIQMNDETPLFYVF
jgi:CRISPR-associated endonuclease Cas2